MSDLILTINAQVISGPQISISLNRQIQAYDKIDVVVKPGEDKLVEIQPVEASKVTLLLIRSSLYSSIDSKDPKLTYRVSDGQNFFPPVDKNGLSLNAPQLYLGGALDVFDMAPKQLKFNNNFNKDNENDTVNQAIIEIFVARDATEENT